MLFHNVTISGNAGRGVEFFLPHFGNSSPPLGVVLNSSKIENNSMHGIFFAGGGGFGGLPSGEGRLEFRHLRISNAPDSGLYIENKNGGPFLVVQNVTLRNVSTRESSEAPIHIGSGPYHCERHCCSEGASFNGVVLHDSVDRVPLEVQGNVSRMSGAVTVHNPALSPSRCVSALPELHVACDHKKSPLRSDDDAAQGARGGGHCGAGASSSGKDNCAGTGNVADFVLRAKVILALEDDALLVHMAWRFRTIELPNN